MGIVTARYWECDVCGYRWPYSDRIKPDRCRNVKCRTRRWNSGASKPAPDRKAIAVAALTSVYKDEPEPTSMCKYTEYDQDTGDTYRCALRQHSAKVKHVRGEKL